MHLYSYKDVFEQSLKYFNEDELAAKVFVDKYALQNGEGEYLEPTPSDMHQRLAKEFVRIENKYPNPLSYEEIYPLLDKFKYIIPQGSPMSGIGNPYQVMSISNCFVLEPPYDSYAGILKTDQEQAHIMRRRGGVGFDISNIRPKGLATKNAAKTTDGIGLFMERFSNTCREVAQGGRRGALMLSISCHHPEIRTFINIKKDLKKITGANISIRFTDEFMNAVKNKEKVQLRWPVESTTPIISIYEDAESIWNEVIEAAHASAEPGLLFWDNALRNTPAQIYKDYGYNHTSTNPCFAPDTLIAVADGRNAVSIKQLAEEGKDIPVYSVDKNGSVSIKMGRNPRITGFNQKLIRVHLDDGSYLDTTPNHNFITLDGEKIEAKNLKPGTSLPRFSKRIENIVKDGKPYYRVRCDVHDPKKDQIFEHRLIAKFYQPDEWKKYYNKAKENGWIRGGLVIHHKDYDSLNNSPENLQIMTFRDHTVLHAQVDTQGEKNGRYSGITNDQLKEHAIILTQNINRRFSNEDWLKYAAENNLPQGFSSFRKNALGNVLDLAKWAAAELKLEFVNQDPRLVTTYKKMLDQGYQTKIVGNQVLVEKICEQCKNIFDVDHLNRESAFCSNLCALKYINSDTEFQNKRINKTRATYQLRSTELKRNQAKVWSQLKFDLKRDPMLKEWEQTCKIKSISYRLRTKFGFQNLNELKEAGDNYNHKVLKIEELSNEHTVYNITVDDNHTVGVVTNNEKTSLSGIFTAQCGEIILSNGDSCRLLLINLASYVNNPFTKEAYFDYDLFANHTIKAQRLMDDIVDLEIECIDRILTKIDKDPEPEEIKIIEKNLWKQVRVACINGRRTGLGITGLGDCLAYLNIKYGSEKSIETTEEIYKQLAINSYKSSCILAGERGAFPVFNKELEKDHPFLNRIWEASPEVYELYLKNGRRNIANTTTPPAGSTSIEAQVSSGIESIFMLSYVRRKKVNPDSKDVRVDYVDVVGDSWQEFKVYHHGLKKWMEITQNNNIEESPYFGATSNDIDWVSGVRLQATAQKWVCHSISRTANVPAETTVDTIKQIYMTAWESGCKGYTVYRAGSRSGVLVESTIKNEQSGRPEQIIITHAPARTKELPCEIHRATVKGTKWIVLVGLLKGNPYELFMSHAELLDVPNKVVYGNMIKTGKGKYNLHFESIKGPIIIEDIIKTSNDDDSAWATRMISTSLRHGIPVDVLVEQLSKNGTVVDINMVLARILKKYAKSGSVKCPKCGSNELIFRTACFDCTGCGYSGCS